MVDREAYIDLVFRNGLKDLEVLPPQGLWEEIQPSIEKRNSLFILRIAAGVAVLFSLGLAAALLTRESSLKLPSSSITLDLEIFNAADIYINAGTPLKVVASNETVTNQEARHQYLADNKDYLDYKTISTDDIVNMTDIYVKSLTKNPVNNNHEVDYIPILGNTGFKIFNTTDAFGLAPDNVKKIEKWMFGALASPTYYLQSSPNNLTLQLNYRTRKTIWLHIQEASHFLML